MSGSPCRFPLPSLPARPRRGRAGCADSSERAAQPHLHLRLPLLYPAPDLAPVLAALVQSIKQRFVALMNKANGISAPDAIDIWAAVEAGLSPEEARRTLTARTPATPAASSAAAVAPTAAQPAAATNQVGGGQRQQQWQQSGGKGRGKRARGGGQQGQQQGQQQQQGVVPQLHYVPHFGAQPFGYANPYGGFMGTPGYQAYAASTVASPAPAIPAVSVAQAPAPAPAQGQGN